MLLDITVLSCDEDEDKVDTLKRIIKKFSELTFCPDALLGESRFSALKRDLERSQYTFLFLDEGSEKDGWMWFQEQAAVMQRVQEHSGYIVPVKAHSQVPIPWLLQMYHVLELSALLKGKRIEDVEVGNLTEGDINMSLMNALVTAIGSKNEKLVINLAYTSILILLNFVTA